eukprot:3168232-Pyramimonas_sp.AAC.1
MVLRTSTSEAFTKDAVRAFKSCPWRHSGDSVPAKSASRANLWASGSVGASAAARRALRLTPRVVAAWCQSSLPTLLLFNIERCLRKTVSGICRARTRTLSAHSAHTQRTLSAGSEAPSPHQHDQMKHSVVNSSREGKAPPKRAAPHSDRALLAPAGVETFPTVHSLLL